MARLEHPQYPATFELPDEPTVRQMLAFDEIIERGVGKTDGVGMYERLWPAVVKLAQDWQCETLELSVDAMDKTLPGEAIAVLKWACLKTFEHFSEVRNTPKN